MIAMTGEVTSVYCAEKLSSVRFDKTLTNCSKVGEGPVALPTCQLSSLNVIYIHIEEAQNFKI